MKKLIIEDEDGNLIDLFPDEIKKKIVTEDLGKELEMAICLLNETPYDGKFKYCMTKAELLKDKLVHFKKVFPYQLIHTAKNGSRFDFTAANSEDIKLSAKSTKKDYKVCPQVIGQPSKKKFCQFFEIDLSLSYDQIKIYIQTNITKLLETYFHYTFDCPILYYNEDKNNLWFIKNHTNINWDDINIEFSHIKKNKTWNESSSIYFNGYSIGEFQIHNHRDNIKFRWNLLNLLICFHNEKNNKYFEIIDLLTLTNI
jgi:hypothetical protein